MFLNSISIKKTGNENLSRPVFVDLFEKKDQIEVKNRRHNVEHRLTLKIYSCKGGVLDFLNGSTCEQHRTIVILKYSTVVKWSTT